MIDNDTIVAIATAPGVGGVGIVRLSGPASFEIAAALFSRPLQPRRMTHCLLRDAAGDLVDEGMAVSFLGPASFTGEDVVEWHGHGGPVVLQQAVATCQAHGARLARPGEFSERAFLNGKLDLAQAEAIADRLASGSVAAARGAMTSLQGRFSALVTELADQLMTARLFVEATLDFPDEEDVDRGEEFGLTERLVGVQQALGTLMQDTRCAVTLNQGVTIAILGAPNAGKSSLLNALSGEDRAIVTEIAGTTRDVLPVDLVIGGLPVRLIDTAGIRQTDDPVEAEGVRRALEQAKRADIVLLVDDAVTVDAARPNDRYNLFQSVVEDLDRSFWSEVESRVIRVASKADLASTTVETEQLVGQPISTSVVTGAGIDELVEALLRKVGLEDGFAREGSAFTARARHLEALAECAAALTRAQDTLDAQDGGVLLAEELRAAHDALGRILGRVTPDDLLGVIFSQFCIGK